MVDVPEQAAAAAKNWQDAFHGHPELGFDEHWTSVAIADYLDLIGWRVETGLAGGTGVFAWLPATAAGTVPRLLLRAELDALPVQDETEIPGSSTVRGACHACGHDAHMAILLGTATAVARGSGEHGEIGLVFQPGEELLGGGRRLIEEGLLARFDADLCLALHGWPGLPAGIFGLIPGPCMAAVDACKIRVLGRPGHGASPHETVDPIVAAAELVLSLQTIISRNLDPTAPAVLTIGRINGGSADNAVAPEVTLSGTIRYFEQSIGKALAEGISARAAGVADAYGARAQVEMISGYPPTVNDPGVVGWLTGLVEKEFGEASIGAMLPAMVSEDFSYYLRERRGAMIFLGTGGPYPLHHSLYRFPTELLASAMRLYLAVIEALASCPTPPWR